MERRLEEAGGGMEGRVGEGKEKRKVIANGRERVYA